MNLIHPTAENAIDAVMVHGLIQAKGAILAFAELNINLLTQELQGLDPESENLAAHARQILTALAHWQQLVKFTGDLNYADSE